MRVLRYDRFAPGHGPGISEFLFRCKLHGAVFYFVGHLSAPGTHPFILL